MATPEERPDAAPIPSVATAKAAPVRPSLVRELAGVLDRRRTRRQDRAQDLLANAGVVLSSSFEREATLQAIGSLIVPSLADWFALQLFDDSGVLQPALTMHADPRKLALADAYNRRWPPGETEASPVAIVARTGQPQLVSSVTDEMLQAVARDPEHLRAIRDLGMTSVIIVPLIARDRIFGAMSLVAAESRHRYDEHDLQLAEDLARRLAVALDNVRLFAAAREAAERTARLQAVTAGLARALAPEDVADTVVKEGMAAFQASGGILCLATEDGRWLEIVRHRHARADGAGIPTVRDRWALPALGRGAQRQAALSGEQGGGAVAVPGTSRGESTSID